MDKILYFLILELKLYHISSLFQQAHYKINHLSKYLLKHFIYYNLFYTFLLFFYKYYFYKVLLYICLVFSILYYFLIIFRLKIKLKWTNRIIRLFIISSIFNILYLGLDFNYFVIYEYLMLVLFSILNYFEYLNQLRYIKMANRKLKEFKGIKIGITGSFGKTTTKTFMDQILSKEYKVLSSPKSYNTLIGIAKFINSHYLNSYDIIILEFGATKKNDIEKLLKYYPIDIGILTKIGYMHLDSFKSFSNIRNEKMKILDKVSLAFTDNKNKIEGSNYIYTYGINEGDFRASILDSKSFELYYLNQRISIIEYLYDSNLDILNTLPALSFLYLNHKLKDSIKLDLKKEKHHASVYKSKDLILIDNSFNANLEGSKEAIKYLKSLNMLSIIITSGFVENKKIRVIQNIEYSNLIKDLDYILLVRSVNTFDIVKELRKYLVKYYLFNSFKSAYRFYLSIEGKKALLIDNDLPDIYKEWD